jgi:hypothetical protein
MILVKEFLVKIKQLLLTFTIMAFLFLSCGDPTSRPAEWNPDSGQDSGILFTVNIPTYQSEADYVLGLIQDIVFFEAYLGGITGLVPNAPLINSLKDRVRAGQSLNNNDRDQLRALFKDEIFDLADYDRAIVSMNNAARVAERHAYRFIRYQERWGLFLPNEFNIHMTLYGPGGQYNPWTAEMFVRACNWSTPLLLEIIMHEAVHIAIEDRIIQRYNVSQYQKERIVDHFTVHLFDDILRNYWWQQQGDPTIDVIFQQSDVFDNLPSRVRDFLAGGTGGLDYSAAFNIAGNQATVSTPTPLEGVWINQANWAFAHSFQGNGFCIIFNGSPGLRGTFILSSGNINFSSSCGQNWSQPYRLRGNSMDIDLPVCGNFFLTVIGPFSRQ